MKNSRQVEFIERYMDEAVKVARKHKIPASVMLAQAGVESAWGSSLLSKPPHYNFFGIKRHGNHKSVSFMTTEYFGGKRTRVKAEFCSYGSVEEAFEDYARVIKKPIYAKAHEKLKRNNVVGFVEEMAKHYATDPYYAQIILNVMNKYGLWKLDEEVEK